jgi:hypothetical protein
MNKSFIALNIINQLQALGSQPGVYEASEIAPGP